MLMKTDTLKNIYLLFEINWVLANRYNDNDHIMVAYVCFK